MENGGIIKDSNEITFNDDYFEHQAVNTSKSILLFEDTINNDTSINISNDSDKRKCTSALNAPQINDNIVHDSKKNDKDTSIRVPQSNTINNVDNFTCNQENVDSKHTDLNFDEILSSTMCNDSKKSVPDSIEALYEYVNCIYVDVLANKNKLDEFTKLISGFTIRMKAMEDNFELFKSNMLGRVLGYDAKIEYLEKMKNSNKNNLNKKVDENAHRIGNLLNFENACKRLDEEISQLRVDIDKNISDLETLANGVKEVPHKYKTAEDYPPSFKYHPVEYGNPILKHDVIILGDSNLNNTVTSQLKRGINCATFFCPTLDHVDVLLSKVKVQKDPNTILLHCGTNHLYNDAPGIKRIEDFYVRIIKQLKAMFPGAEIIISSLLPRKEGLHNGTVKNLNDFLYGICCSTNKVRFMRNKS